MKVDLIVTIGCEEPGCCTAGAVLSNDQLSFAPTVGVAFAVQPSGQARLPLTITYSVEHDRLAVVFEEERAKTKAEMDALKQEYLNSGWCVDGHVKAKPNSAWGGVIK